LNTEGGFTPSDLTRERPMIEKGSRGEALHRTGRKETPWFQKRVALGDSEGEREKFKEAPRSEVQEKESRHGVDVKKKKTEPAMYGKGEKGTVVQNSLTNGKNRQNKKN